MEDNKNNNQVKEAQWKAARKGIIFFSILHFLFLIIEGNDKMAIITVGLNYGVTAWYIWRQIKKDKITKDFELKGFLVALIIFLIRFAIGLLL
jgi:hypothetical protein